MKFVSCVLALHLLWLSGWPSPVRAQQWPDERRIGALHCHADFPLTQRTAILNETAALVQQVPQILTIPAGEGEIRVFLFQKQATFRAYVREYFPNVPMRRALFIKPRGPGMVFAYEQESLDEDLRHETTHAVLHTIFPMVPLWLDEGLAEYFEVPASQRRQGHSHLIRFRQELATSGIPNLWELEDRSELTEMDANDYRHAWAWVHFLLHGPDAVREEFQAYLRDLHHHVPPGRLSERLSRQVPDWHQQLVVHFQGTFGDQ